MAARTYTGAHLDVSFDAEVCIHAAECVRNLPQVFDTARRPWILPDAAEPDAVRAVVARCPSGALAVVEHRAAPQGAGVAAPEAMAAPAGPAPSAPAAPSPALEITAREAGPFVVTGPVRVRAADGTLLREAPRVSLCRCTRSATQPFCDGSHKRPPA